MALDAEKAFDRIQCLFIIKSLHKLQLEGIYLNIIKATYDKTTDNIILNSEKLKAFPLTSGNTRMSTLTAFIQHSTGSSSQSY